MPVVAATAQSDVLRACRAIGKDMGAISVPNAPSAQVYVGWPTTTKIVEAIQQDGSPVHVTIWPHAGHKTTRYHPTTSLFSATNPTFTAAVVQSGLTATITFAGLVSAANVHTVINNLGDAYLLSAAGQTLNALAISVAAQINALHLSGVTATSSGPAVTVTGVDNLYCNIGASGLLIRETGRVARQIQVTVWAPTANDVSDPALCLRDAAGQQILAALGGTDRVFLTDDLGLAVMCQYNGMDRWDDGEQLKYSIFRWDLFFDCEHAITQIVPMTPVGAIEFSTQTNTNPPSTALYGGPA